MDHEEYAQAQAVAREIRETVGDQVHDLVVEREGLGTYEELINRVRHVGTVGQQLGHVRGQQRQHAEMGLAVQPLVVAERETLELLRSAAMGLAAAAASWVVALDVDARRAELAAAQQNGRRRRQRPEETI